MTYEADVSIESFVSFHIEYDAAYYKRKRNIYKDLVAERNNLVHHSYLNFDMNSIESCRQIEVQLDEQLVRIQSEIKDLQRIANHIDNSKKELVNILSSTEFKNQIIQSWLSNSQLVMLLSDISVKIAKDGWASLSIAGKLIREAAPEEMILLKEKYGHKSLKPLILEAGIFDLREEPTKTDGSMIVYRVKPEVSAL